VEEKKIKKLRYRYDLRKDPKESDDREDLKREPSREPQIEKGFAVGKHSRKGRFRTQKNLRLGHRKPRRNETLESVPQNHKKKAGGGSAGKDIHLAPEAREAPPRGHQG